MRTNPADIWARCLLLIEKKTTRQSFETWFHPTNCTHFDEKSINIEVPSSFFADWLEENYTSLIRSAIFDQTSLSPDITFSILEEDGPEPPAFSESPSFKPHLTRDLKSYLNPRYTFDNFVVGESNQLAHAASLAVARAPGMTAFNPLVVYGGVGLGKTHILQAIGNFCLAHGTAQNVIYVFCEKFFTEFIRSRQNNNTAEFAEKYRGADILLVDDIQFFIRKESTQVEFFHTFNVLHQHEKQIVLSSDCPPEQLSLDERLISRFQWGLVVGIEPPDLETRIAILKSKAEHDNIFLSDEVASFIAVNVSSNIRELEGSLIRLIAHCSLEGRDISLDLAKEVLQNTSKTSPPEITIELIQQKTAEHFGIPFDLIIGKTRKREVTEARHAAMYLARKLTDKPFKAIGLHFGGRDHSTVVHACRLIETRIKAEPSFGDLIESLSNSILAGTLL